jgi:hypothetical protein
VVVLVVTFGDHEWVLLGRAICGYRHLSVVSLAGWLASLFLDLFLALVRWFAIAMDSLRLTVVWGTKCRRRIIVFFCPSARLSSVSRHGSITVIMMLLFARLYDRGGRPTVARWYYARITATGT